MKIIFVLFIGIYLETLVYSQLWIPEQVRTFPPLKYQKCSTESYQNQQASSPINQEQWDDSQQYYQQQISEEPPRQIKLKNNLWKFYRKLSISQELRQQFSYGCIHEIQINQTVSFTKWLINYAMDAKKYIVQLKHNITRYPIELYNNLTQKKIPQPYSYSNNYASLYGGAKILMKSSFDIHQCSSILKNQMDQYLYVDQPLPFSVIISLSEQIAIEEITLKSSQIYSKIVKQFLVQGTFSWQNNANNVWTDLGTFTAQNNFEQQKFPTPKKIVRYIRVTILTAYGKWRYFTLTQIKVHGKSMFADALLHADDKRNNSLQQQIKQNQNATKNQQYFKRQQQKQVAPHDTNLIGQLFTHLQQLKNKNEQQKQQITNLNNKLADFSNILIQQQNNTNLYLCICGLAVFLSLITAIILIGVCILRKENLVSSKKLSKKRSRTLLTVQEQNQ